MFNLFRLISTCNQDSEINGKMLKNHQLHVLSKLYYSIFTHALAAITTL